MELVFILQLTSIFGGVLGLITALSFLWNRFERSVDLALILTSLSISVFISPVCFSSYNNYFRSIDSWFQMITSVQIYRLFLILFDKKIQHISNLIVVSLFLFFANTIFSFNSFNVHLILLTELAIVVFGMVLLLISSLHLFRLPTVTKLSKDRKIGLLLFLSLNLISSGFQVFYIIGFSNVASLYADILLFFVIVSIHVKGESIREIRDFCRFLTANVPRKQSTNYGNLENRLKFLFETEKIYLHNDLRLEALASELNTNTKTLSQFLNKELGSSFLDIVNKYRTEEAVKLLIERPELSVTTIAFNAGFNSLSAFHRSFHKLTGRSAREFKRNPPTGNLL